MPTAAKRTATAAKAASRISVSRFVASESSTTDDNVRTPSSGIDESSLRQHRPRGADSRSRIGPPCGSPATRAAAVLSETHIDVRRRQPRRVVVVNRPDDADDRQPRRVAGDANSLAERVGAFPVSLGDRFVDDRHRDARRIVRRREVASEAAAECPSSRSSPGSRRPGTSAPRCPMAARTVADEKPVVVRLALERQSPGERHGLDAGNRPYLVEHRRVERIRRRRAAVLAAEAAARST